MLYSVLVNLSRLFCVGIALALAAAAIAQPKAPLVQPGDRAPEVTVAEWMRGEAFGGWERHKVSVIEFWATWCVPCKEAMPHLSQLAKKHAGSVGFYSVSVMEQGEKIPERVRDFIKGNEENMQYSVGRDADDAKNGNMMWFRWILGARQEGIPAAFIVDQKGVIEWIGHPLNLDRPLEEALAGKLDVAKERTKFKVFLDQIAAKEAFLAKLLPAERRFESGDHAGSFRDLDAAAGSNGEFRYTAERTKIRLLSIYEPSEGLTYLSKLRKRIPRGDWWKYMVEFMSIDPRVKDKEAFNEFRTRAVNEFVAAGRDKDAYLLAYGGWILRATKKVAESEDLFDRAIRVFGNSRASKDPAEKTRFDNFVKTTRGH